MVARTIAQQYSKLGEAATHPFQYALSTRAGTECVTHMVQALTSEDREATILSIDGIGAYDLISRNAMLRGVLSMVDGAKLIPYIRLFYGSPSTFLWEDDMGNVHHVRQGEGGEQGDPLMPLLFSLGMHSALVAVKAKLKEGERLFAFLDDVYVTCTLARVLPVFQVLEAELFNKAHISVHQGKTLIWNRGGQEPSGAVELTRAARKEKPEAVVWRGDPMLSLADQGLIVLGAPVGQPEYVKARLEEKSRQHQKLLERIPFVQDVQAAWLLVLYGAAPRANLLLRTVQPELTLDSARNHDEQLAQCVSRILQTEPFPPEVKMGQSMPLTLGGLGIGGTLWGSWADCLEMIRVRHPDVATKVVRGFSQASSQCCKAVSDAVSRLQAVRARHRDRDPTEPKHGWQKVASLVVHKRHREEIVWPQLSESERASVRSQSGPLASVPLTAFPVC